MRLTNWHFICSVWLATRISNAVHGPYNMNVIWYRKDDLWVKNFRPEFQERFVSGECSNNNLVYFIVHIITFMCTVQYNRININRQKNLIWNCHFSPWKGCKILSNVVSVFSCKMFFISVSFGYFYWVKFRIFNLNYHE